MWPICREPVTFGGGITMQKAGPGAAGSARNKSPLAQNSAHLLSMSCGSYALAISRAISSDDSFHNPGQLVVTNVQNVILDYTGRKESASTRRGTHWENWIVEENYFLLSSSRTIDSITGFRSSFVIACRI